MAYTEKIVKRLQSIYGCTVRLLSEDIAVIDGPDGSIIMDEDGHKYELKGYDVMSIENGLAIGKEMEDINIEFKIKGFDIKTILIQRLRDGKKILTDELGYKILDYGIIATRSFDLIYYDIDFNIKDVFEGFGSNNIARVKEFIELPDGNIRIEVKVYMGENAELADKAIIFDKAEKKFKEA